MGKFIKVHQIKGNITTIVNSDIIELIIPSNEKSSSEIVITDVEYASITVFESIGRIMKSVDKESDPYRNFVILHTADDNLPLAVRATYIKFIYTAKNSDKGNKKQTCLRLESDVKPYLFVEETPEKVAEIIAKLTEGANKKSKQ